MKAVLYGAGNIGRGFIGATFYKSGYETVFIDVNKEVVSRLNADKKYPVVITGNDESREETVRAVRAVDSADTDAAAKEILACDIMATAVGAGALKHIAAPIAKGISARIAAKRNLNILLCENLADADRYFKAELFKHLTAAEQAAFDTYIGLVDASIGRMVPALTDNGGNPLRVAAEEFDTLYLDKDGFKGEIPKLYNTVIYSPFKLFIQRKLYMHNMSHALTAYLGNLCGDRYIYEAISRPEIRVIAYAALIESARAIAKENNADIGDLIDHANDLIRRFQNAALADTVERVGKDTARKLSYSDRLIGALILCNEHTIRPAFICAGVAAALLFAPASDSQSTEVYSYCKRHGVFETLVQYTGLNRKFESNPQIRYMTELYDMLGAGGDMNAVIKFADKESNRKDRKDGM